MLYQNLEIHNCVQTVLNEKTGFCRMYRIPAELSASLDTLGGYNCGTELRFVPLEDEVRITLRAPDGRFGRAYIYYGGVQGGYPEHMREFDDRGTEIVIRKAKNAAFLQQVTGAYALPYSPQVVRVLLENNENEIGSVHGALRPPTADELPRKTLLCYGSSITHGSMALLPMNYYVFRLGEELGVDTRNFGFAGHARLEKEMAEYIASIPFDAATLEMGVNLMHAISPEEMAARVRTFVPIIANAYQSAPVFCTDIYSCGADLTGDNEKAAAFRSAVQNTLRELALPNVHIVGGRDILPRALVTQDAVHPSARGAEEIVHGWTRVLRPFFTA